MLSSQVFLWPFSRLTSLWMGMYILAALTINKNKYTEHVVVKVLLLTDSVHRVFETVPLEWEETGGIALGIK